MGLFALGDNDFILICPHEWVAWIQMGLFALGDNDFILICHHEWVAWIPTVHTRRR